MHAAKSRRLFMTNGGDGSKRKVGWDGHQATLALLWPRWIDRGQVSGKVRGMYRHVERASAAYIDTRNPLGIIIICRNNEQ